MQYRLAYAWFNSATNACTSRKILVKIGPVTSAKNRLESGNCVATKPQFHDHHSVSMQHSETDWDTATLISAGYSAIIFTARRYAKRGICRRCASVCHTPVLYQNAKHRITQIMPYDSPLTLVFWHQSSRRNSNGITPYGATNAGGVGKNSPLSTTHVP